MPTISVVAEFIIEIDAEKNDGDKIVEQAEEAICRVDSFNTEILGITVLETGYQIDMRKY